jgi:hypothetical protein
MKITINEKQISIMPLLVTSRYNTLGELVIQINARVEHSENKRLSGYEHEKIEDVIKEILRND